MTRRVLVTGATSGIGLATVLHAARLGFAAVGSVRTEEGAAAVQRAAKEAGLEVETIVLDLADPDSYTGKVADLGPWALVNNAGYTNSGAIEDVPVDEARLQMESMVLAPATLIQEALPAMKRRGSGRIINIVSAAVGSGVPLLGWYQASKHALAGITEAARNELAYAGVDVVAVDPGMVDTPIWDKTLADLQERFRGAALRPSYTRAMELIEKLRPVMRPPEAVAEVVGRALTSGRPKASYRIGPDAFVVNAGLSFLPRTVTDGLTRRIMRSPRG